MLEILIEKANKYLEMYENGNSPISDEEYDEIIEEIAKLEKETGIIYPNSPTQRISGNNEGEILHLKKMLSLKKTKDSKDLEWKVPFVIQPKIDGMSVELIYKKGILSSISSRKNGVTGDKKMLKNIPKKILTDRDVYSVYGEATISKENWGLIKEKTNYSNNRNLVAGILNSKEEHPLLGYVDFLAYSDIDESDEVSTLLYLKKLGFNIPETLREIPDDLLSFVEKCKYPTDGIVSKVAEKNNKDKLGYTNKHPKWAIAYKFEDERKKTILRDITYKISRKGTLCPVAVFDKVEIDNTEITNASLSNLNILKELKLGIGDTILVEKSNMIIPKVVKNLTKSDTYQPITECPNCGGKLQINDGVLFCNNNCYFLEKISYLCSKNGLDIKGLSLKTLKKINSVSPIVEYKDLYNIDFSKVIKLEGFGEKSVDNIKVAIEKSKKCSVIEFFSALGLPNMSKGRLEKLYKNQTYNEFMSLLKGDFSCYNGFGESIVANVHNYLKENEVSINELSKIFSFKNEEKENKQGIKFCLTGKFQQKKSEIVKLILEKYPNWIEVKDVTKETNVLVIPSKDFTSTKVEKGIKNKCKITTLEELTFG